MEKLYKNVILYYITCKMKLEITPEDFKKLKEMEDIAQKPHRAVCGYSGGGDTFEYAYIELGKDFINNLRTLADRNSYTLQTQLKIEIENFLAYEDRKANLEDYGI